LAIQANPITVLKHSVTVE